MDAHKKNIGTLIRGLVREIPKTLRTSRRYKRVTVYGKTWTVDLKGAKIVEKELALELRLLIGPHMWDEDRVDLKGLMEVTGLGRPAALRLLLVGNALEFWRLMARPDWFLLGPVERPFKPYAFILPCLDDAKIFTANRRAELKRLGRMARARKAEDARIRAMMEMFPGWREA